MEVMEKRELEDDPEGCKYKYYCHYEDYNRRLDEWVKSNKIKARDTDMVKPVTADEDPHSKKRMSRQDTQAAAMLENDEHAGLDEESIREHEEATRVKNIQSVELGKHEMMTWYYSPLPEEYRYLDKLYFCEWDLRFFRSKKTLKRHLSKYSASQQHPPGDEIYRYVPPGGGEGISVFEVDGAGENKLYCQNLSFLAKLFWTTKRCTTTWIRSFFTSSARPTIEGHTSPRIILRTPTVIL